MGIFSRKPSPPPPSLDPDESVVAKARGWGGFPPVIAGSRSMIQGREVIRYLDVADTAIKSGRGEFWVTTHSFHWDERRPHNGGVIYAGFDDIRSARQFCALIDEQIRLAQTP